MNPNNQHHCVTLLHKNANPVVTCGLEIWSVRVVKQIHQQGSDPPLLVQSNWIGSFTAVQPDTASKAAIIHPGLFLYTNI